MLPIACIASVAAQRRTKAASSALAAPENLAATPTTDGFEIVWDAVPGASLYRVQLQAAGGDWSTVAQDTTAPNSFLATGFALNTAYDIRVRAEAAGAGAWATLSGQFTAPGSPETSFTVDGIAHGNGETIQVGHDATSVEVAATHSGTLSALTGDTGLATGDNTCTFHIVSQDGIHENDFSITLHRAGLAPANTVAPEATWDEATTISTTDGTWTGDPAPTFSYQWQAKILGAFTDLSGETANSLTGVGAGIFRCVVRAENTLGFSSTASNEVTI